MKNFFKIKKLRKTSKKGRKKINVHNYEREPIPQKVKDLVWNRDGGKCVICGTNEHIEFDHIVPVVRGGKSTYRNLQLLCEYHNAQKNAKSMDEMDWKTKRNRLKELVEELEKQKQDIQDALSDLNKQHRKLEKKYDIKDRKVHSLQKELDDKIRPSTPFTIDEAFYSCIDRIVDHLMVDCTMEFSNWETNPLQDEDYCDYMDDVIKESIEYHHLYDYPLPDWMKVNYDGFEDEMDWMEYIVNYMMDYHDDLEEDGMYDYQQKEEPPSEESVIDKLKTKKMEHIVESTELELAIQKQKDFLNHNWDNIQ